MWKNRLLYLAVIAGCLIFFLAQGLWFSRLLLLWVLSLPLLSLLLTLPALLTAKISPQAPGCVPVGTRAQASLQVCCRLPVCSPGGRLWAYNTLTGEQTCLGRRKCLPTAHCGRLVLTLKRAYITDYLGLFKLPVKTGSSCNLLITPVPVAADRLPVLKKRPVTLWRPVPGGGWSEDHDLRPYRPGDSLHLIHWKLSAKTGKLIFREPVEALQSKAVLSLVLSGTPETLNFKLGRLLWLSQALADRNFTHHIHCQTGSGLFTCPVTAAADCRAAIFQLLAMPAAPGPAAPHQPEDAFWQYTIGGDAHEE